MLLVSAFLLGLLIGSFLNVCIHRWPAEVSVVRPRSHCPLCKTALSWFDNVPLLSYALLKGRCRHCGGPISVRYPAVELLTGLLFVAVAMQQSLGPMAFKMALYGSMMLILVFTDLEQYILPDEVTLGGAALGLALSLWIPLAPTVSGIFWFFAGHNPAPMLASFVESASAAAVFGVLLYFISEVYFRVRNIEGLGLGDVKLVAMMGAFWGFGDTFVTVILASVVAAVTGLLIILIGRKQWTFALPFGSYLGAAAILVMLWGGDILDWYWGMVLPTD